jgi:hypothetical protein
VILSSAFALGVGDFVFRTIYAPVAPDYLVEANVRPFSLPASEQASKHMYLRRTWHLTRVPDYAWIELLGHDVLQLKINGRSVERPERAAQRSIDALVTDITPYLHVGKNCIAIHVAQTMLDRNPAVAVNAVCEFADGSQLSLSDANNWRATNVYDRQGAFWYETDFKDEQWERPNLGPMVTWRGQVAVPPRAITAPRHSHWIRPAESRDGAAVLARTFELDGRPAHSWLRVLATGPYRLAINGLIVADDHLNIGTGVPFEPKEQTFDVGPLLRAGENTVSVFATTAGETPRLRADLEATTRAGNRTYVATDEQWRALPGYVADWHELNPALHSGFQPSKAEVGYLGVVPRQIMRELGEVRLPPTYWIKRSAAYICLVAACGAVAWYGCKLVGGLLMRLTNGAGERRYATLPYIALLPSIVATAVAWLASWDLRWTVYDIYRPSWLLGIALLVPMQWLLLIAVSARRQQPRSETVRPLRKYEPWQRVAFSVCALSIVAVALWLRVRDITAEPIHHDEISAYAFTQSVLERGVPGGQVHPDLPFGYCSTSELAYYPAALCALFVDDPRLVLRIPAVFWSIATLVLLAYMGARWFNPYVGLVAAALYGLSPHVIGWANLGRYLSQVQFFTLLTMFFTYEAFRIPGQVRKGMLWAAAFSISAMYLSWEGAGMFGVGLAIAVLVLRRHDMQPIVRCASVYAAILFVLVIVGAQNAHRISQQTQRLWYGEGISDLAVKPMWRYPFFDSTFYLLNSSWTRDALIPMIAFSAACFMAVRHRWRIPLRFSIICLATNAFLMSAFLPLRTNRYSYHLLPILVLLSAAVVIAALETVWRHARSRHFSWPHRAYARVVAAATLLVFIAVASGHLIRTSQIEDFQVAAFDVRQLRYPHWDGPSEFLRQHVRKEDAVIATFPHTQKFYMAARPDVEQMPQHVNYWLESTLIVQATLGDSAAIPRDRRSGTAMIYDIEQLKELFSRHERVWYCTTRFGQSRINDNSVSQFLRQHMDVVYEDFGTAVLLRDNNHRTAPLRVEEDEAGRMASDYYLR